LIKLYRFFVYIILALFLLLGSKEFRYKKADFLSDTLYLPFLTSVNYIQAHLDLLGENWRLHNILARQEIKINHLQQELNFYQKQDLEFNAPVYDYLTSEVISSNGIYGQKYFILDKGISDQIKSNMPVLGTEGIIGKIVNTGQNFSLLMPLSHTNFKLGVMLKKNYLHGLLEADLEGRIYMNLLRKGSEVSLGDTVVTSHYSTIFPPFYPVGRIKKIKIAADRLNLNAEIEPFCDLQSLTTVIILKYTNEYEYNKELGIENEIIN